MAMRHLLTSACAVTIIGTPLAIAALVWGGKLLIALLHALPQG